MSAVQERTWSPTDADREPARAHYAWDSDPTNAICGARILGVSAPEGHPVCEDCKRIREEMRDTGRRLWGETP